MRPFSKYFYQLRVAHGIRQIELAELLGYEQSYISALEIGTKGPPTSEFIERLIRALSLSDIQQAELHEVVEASQRKFIIPVDLSEDIHWMLLNLHRHLDSLHPAQVRLIQEIIGIKDEFAKNTLLKPKYLRMQQKEDRPM